MRNPRILVVDRDESLATQVRKATADLRPRPEVVACTRVGTVEEVVGTEGPFDVLVAGPSVITAAGLVGLRRLRVQHPAISLMMASQHRPQAAFRDIVRVGAVDVLQLPATDAVIAEAIGEAIDIARRSSRATEPVAGGNQRAAGGTGTVISVVSASGGTGKTFLATNLAYYLHAQHRLTVCVIDFDLQFGELATALRLRPRYTVTDAMAHDDSEGTDLAERLGEFVVEHDTGIFVLAGPSEPAEADAIEPSGVARLLTALRSRYDVVVVDTAPSLSEPVLTAVDLSDQILVLGTLDLPSVRNMGVLLSTLSQLKIPESHIQLLLNKVEKDVGIDVDQISKYFSQGFSAVIPYGRDVSRSLNMGMPILAYLPGCDVSRALSTSLGTMALPFPRHPEASDAGAEPGRRRRGRRREREGS